MSQISAQRLKEEGNELFRQQKYQEAAIKYGEAIELDGKNPILFSNRALCCLKMRHYILAAVDASTAVRLDPNYAKAHARRAEAYDALYQHLESKESWRAALDALPKQNLSPAEIKMKESFVLGLDQAYQKLFVVSNAVRCTSLDGAVTPTPLWVRVIVVYADMLRERKDMSGTCVCHYILCDYMSNNWRLLIQALHIYLSTMKYWSATSSTISLIQKVEALHHPLRNLATALMHDMRILHVFDETWPDIVVRLMGLFDAWHHGWKDGKMDDEFREAVLKRLADKGWDDVGPALSDTIDSWMIQGMLGGTGYRHKLEYFDCVLDFIKWGESIWDTEVLTRQESIRHIFDPTFLLSVKKSRMSVFFTASHSSQAATRMTLTNCNRDEYLSGMLHAAREVMELANSLPRDKQDSRLLFTLIDLPLGQAHFTIGHCYQERAKLSISNRDDLSEKAYQSFLEAVKYYPKDDEQHADNLHSALKCMLFCGRASANLQLQTLQELTDAIPCMLPIWAVTAREDTIREYMETIDRVSPLKQLVAQGHVKGTDMYRWPPTSAETTSMI
ncbi:small glutamine-rich tetratricopeptide repeat-containing protein alpha-like isoform 1 [Moniliophthora roreri]|nr:small glutamine-rich tetratricopeptide repeat-containing protein alpha-like isoform 1 [Moniliophthora roreri]